MRTMSIALVAATLIVCATRTLRSHETLTTTVLFDREIVRLLDKHCVMCHAEKSLSFPLETYEQTWVRGRKIRAEVISRHMPPWAAFPGYGQFANDNSLTLRESQFVVSWVEGLGPRNAGRVFLNVQDTSAARPQTVRARARFDEWQLGTPDLTRPLPPVTIEARQPDGVRKVTVDLGLTTERRLRALEFMPADRRGVRAAFFTLLETGQWLGSWTPWYGFMNLPDGVAHRLPAGSHVVAEIHYRGTTERVDAGGTFGMFFESRPATLPAPDLVLAARGDGVGAGAGGSSTETLRASTRLSSQTFAMAVRPEASDGVTSIEVAATSPAGRKDILLFAKDIPTAWPTPYIFRQPVLLAAGTRLSVVAHRAKQAGVLGTDPVRVTISRYTNAPRARVKLPN